MNIFATVTEAEAKVVDAVRDLRQPVVDYVQKGVDLAGERLPKISYPSTVPTPGEVIDSQYEFATALLAAQHDLVKAVTAKVAPLMGIPAGAVADAPEASKSTKSTKAA